MNKMAKITICFLLVFAVAVPAFADGKSSKSTIGRIYGAGAGMAQQTEGLFSGILKNTFSLFNPCLDLVKVCGSIAMKPIDIPFDYLDRAYFKTAGVKAVPKPQVPAKPKSPKK